VWSGTRWVHSISPLISERGAGLFFLHLGGEERLYDRDVIKPRKPSPTESPLLFEIDPEPLAETLTAWPQKELASALI
jgi:hypothetical protein